MLGRGWKRSENRAWKRHWGRAGAGRPGGDTNIRSSTVYKTQVSHTLLEDGLGQRRPQRSLVYLGSSLSQSRTQVKHPRVLTCCHVGRPEPTSSWSKPGHQEWQMSSSHRQSGRPQLGSL
ncbi:hypothetical protein BDV19DRAFT_328430 [Aspergillus venezuelensis]